MSEKKVIYERKHQDMLVRYYLNEKTGVVSFEIIPEEYENYLCSNKNYEDDSIIQLKIVGDNYPGWFSQGRTMRNSETTKRLHFVDQLCKRTEDGYLITTIMEDGRGINTYHHLRFFDGYDALVVSTEIINNSSERIELEMLSTFSMGGLTPFENGISKENLYLHRFRSTWSKEGMHERIALEAIQLEPSATGASANSMRFGSIGSMPVREFFPTLAVEDRKMDCIWAVTLAVPSSWQLEAYRKDGALCISGGIADREFGHWLKKIMPGESFKTPKANITVGTGGIENTLERLTQMQKLYRKEIESESTLPIIYNEFCTTWGRPTLTSIQNSTMTLKDRGIDYYVIDGGWNENDVGDWKEKADLYPDGILEATKLIKKNGFKAGIWFEFENCTINSKIFHEHPDWMLKRDGHIIISGNRAFLDLRKEEVRENLRQSVIEFLKKNGFEYLKIDYNETIGIGCDGAESLGEGLRENMQCVREFYKEIAQALPELVIEICASGGHRLEPSMLSLGSMASCSDAHEIVENPIIAAELHKLVLPMISQVWVVLRKHFSPARTMYALASGFLGRFCLSGDIQCDNPWQNEFLDKAIMLYKKVSHIIQEGNSTFVNCRGISWREPEGYQVLIRYSKDQSEVLIVIHTFGGKLPSVIRLELRNEYFFQEFLGTTNISASIINKTLEISDYDQFDGIVVYASKGGSK